MGRLPVRTGVETEIDDLAGQGPRSSQSIAYVCITFGLLAGALWGTAWMVILVASEVTGGLPFDRVIANLSPTATWVWLGSTLLVLMGVTIGMFVLAARNFVVDSSGVHFQSIAYGRQSLNQDRILRPLITRGSLGGVLYFKRGSRTSSAVITQSDALRLSRLPFYPSLAVTPQFAKRPELLRKYEDRLRSGLDARERSSSTNRPSP